MFLKRLIENNYPLYCYAFDAQQNGLVLPDTYLIDLDTVTENAEKMVAEAKKHNLELYFMLKQIGRNPMIARELMKAGFQGCVVVDYKEALLMLDHQIPLCNVGHLEQVPVAALDRIVTSRPKLMTVYSKEKIRQINEAAKRNHVSANLMLRISDEDGCIYSGQEAGIPSDQINEYVDLIESLECVELKGATVFPALLYDGQCISPTENIHSYQRAKEILEKRGYCDLNYNLPSASCCASFDLIEKLGGTSAEPGHGLTGTTPLHAAEAQPERVGYVYVSEISHNFRNRALCFGGGLYRRGHLSLCAVGSCAKTAEILQVKAPSEDSIDYHFTIEKPCKVGDAAIMCFRTQMFTTRSQVGVIKGLQSGKPELFLYDSQGRPIERNW